MSRGTTSRRLIAALLAVAAVACIAVALREPGSGDAERIDAGAPVSALWSPRRVPGPFVDAVGSANLQAVVGDLVAGTDSCVQVDVTGVGTIASSGPLTPVVPASTQKVLTAAGALAVLGRDFTFRTRAMSDAAPAAGSLERLWLVGGGDPVLSTPEWTERLAREPEYAGGLTSAFTPLASLADSIVSAGVRSIPGGVVGDGSRYTTPTTLAVWPEFDRLEVGALGALVVDDGIDLATGTVVADPALAAATILSSMLAARGVAVGPPSTGPVPAAASEIATLRSAPLTDLVTELLSASDNGSAEGVALAAGHEASGSGTTEAGLAAITNALAAAGVDVAGVTLVDASGLSSQNRVTCTALLQTLDLGSRARFRAVVDGLAIAARRGTLADRFVGTPLEARLWAKTGTLTASAGLVGTFDPVGGRGSPRFASVFNGGFSRSGGYQLTDRLAAAVDAYPQSPPSEQLVPAP